MLGAVGCNNTDSLAVPDPDMVNLCLDVSVAGQTRTTRAGNNPDRYDEQPSGDFEKIGTLRVIIFRDVTKDETTGVETGVVEANRLVMTNDAGQPMYDNLEFKVIANEMKRIYLIANESSLQSPIEGKSATEYLQDEIDVKKAVNISEQLTNWTITMPGDTNTGTVSSNLFSDAPIPMLPLTEFFDVPVNAKQKTDQDEKFTARLFMTRAAAKASFYLNTKGLSPFYDNVQITSISLSGVGAEEYVFPNSTLYSKPKSLTLPDLDMYITSFNCPSNNTLTYLMDNLKCDMVQSDAAESILIGKPIYFPESILKEKGENYVVTVTLSTGITLSAPLSGENTNILNIGGYNAISRDTHIKIEMTFGHTNELKATVTLEPYISKILEPIFGNPQPYYPGDNKN